MVFKTSEYDLVFSGNQAEAKKFMEAHSVVWQASVRGVTHRQEAQSCTLHFGPRKFARKKLCRRRVLEARVMAVATAQVDEQQYVWTGSDEFDVLGDRLDAAPAPLPSIRFAKRIVLVCWPRSFRISPLPSEEAVKVTLEEGLSTAPHY